MGSKTATQARNAKRQADTAELMQNIMTGGEISKRREAELAKAADYGRGLQFIPGSPTVKGLTQKGGQPVFRTGATAADYTGRIVASAPTIGEMLGDMKRAVIGGTPKKQVFTLPTSRPGTPTMDYANMVRDPRPTKGIIPALVETGGISGMAIDMIKSLLSGKEEEDERGPVVDLRKPVIEERVSTYVGVDPYVEKRNTLKQLIAQSQAPGASELNVDTMSDREVDLRLQSYGQGFAMGGLTDTIPPERGPMSEGVASLFKNK